jgi:hypothetical protein
MWRFLTFWNRWSLRCGSVSESNGSINTKIKKMTGCGDSEKVKGSGGYSTSLEWMNIWGNVEQTRLVCSAEESQTMWLMFGCLIYEKGVSVRETIWKCWWSGNDGNWLFLERILQRTEMNAIWIPIQFWWWHWLFISISLLQWNWLFLHLIMVMKLIAYSIDCDNLIGCLFVSLWWWHWLFIRFIMIISFIFHSLSCDDDTDCSFVYV